MNYSQKLFVETLRTNNQSITQVRQKIFHELELCGAVSMAQLIAKLGTDIDRSSVYRTVALFEALGIVQRVRLGWKYKLELSNTFQEHHHHITCLQCGKVISFYEQEKLEGLLKDIARTHKFKLKNHQLELQGVCQDCSQ